MYDDSFQKMREECRSYHRNKNCKLIEEWCKEAGVEFPVGYNNELGKHRMTIYTDKPGWLIGKGGYLVDKFRKNSVKNFMLMNMK